MTIPADLRPLDPEQHALIVDALDALADHCASHPSFRVGGALDAVLTDALHMSRLIEQPGVTLFIGIMPPEGENTNGTRQ